MLNHMLPPDTQVILLLCASFGQNRQTEPKPLLLSEYNSLANWLRENDLTPGKLLDSTIKNRLLEISIGKLNSERLVALLERGVMLGLSVEKWTNQGLWVLGRGEAQYPKRLKQKLKHSAPPILYGVGNIELLSQGGLAIVGSRDVDEEGLDYTQKVAQTCAQQGIQVVSGGARGVDSSAMLAVLEAGGTAVGVLADSLSKAALDRKYRAGITEGRLALVSTYDPNAGFNTGNAMGRNKYIYALADYALVVSSSMNKGGTWAGAVEALEKIKDVPVFVRMNLSVPEGNRQLLEKGAKIFPEAPWENLLNKLSDVATLELEPKNTEVEIIATDVQEVVENKPLIEPLTDKFTHLNQSFPKNIIYELVLPVILNNLEQPKDDKSLAKSLDVQIGQMQTWLKRALEEGKVTKTKNPVKWYVANQKAEQKAEQLSLLD